MFDAELWGRGHFSFNQVALLCPLITGEVAAGHMGSLEGPASLFPLTLLPLICLVNCFHVHSFSRMRFCEFMWPRKVLSVGP